MLKNIKSKEQGFTIIEVLIVLAIAGIIMLIVFLAVPALQRNNRNTQRSNDAARISGAINECLPNNGGNLDECDPTDAGSEFSNYLDPTDNQQLIAIVEGAGSLESAGYNSASKCDGNEVTDEGAGERSFAISYEVETSGEPAPRCV